MLALHNPAVDLRDIFPMQEEKYHACIHPSKIPKLFTKIELRENDFTKYAMKLLALTFVPTSELIGVKWKEINWDKEGWHIPKERKKNETSSCCSSFQASHCNFARAANHHWQ